MTQELSLQDLPQPEFDGNLHPDELEVDGDNPNEMTEEQFGLLCDRMRQNGWLGGPIITNEDDLIADGEHRWRAAQEIGLEEVPVRQYDIDDATRRLWRQELNKIHGEHNEKLDLPEYDCILSSGYNERLEELLDSINEDIEEKLDNYIAENSDPDSKLINPETTDKNHANNPEKEWRDFGAVNYNNEDKSPEYTIKVHFNSYSDLQEFAELVNQTITENTRTIYYPEQEQTSYADKRWINKSKSNNDD